MNNQAQTNFRAIPETVKIQGKIVLINAELLLDYMRYRKAVKAIETDQTEEARETLRLYRENLEIETRNIPRLEGYVFSEIFDELTEQLEKIVKDLI
ncbi:TPA: hypothetical protein U1V47_000987 [Streptococcus suis]|uniref:hypothetical protein n=1 Tax=Streptococcus suis TaxID=1307 RepID=UPI000942F7CE|nr:hypothetical protein [Streptococcus suis]MCK3906116.1 hypothetical protein [Streptococcus suis]MCK3958293.1 hypothetical protein [Streptococcus suis]MCK4013124.1 hypothetical protein [Streptococcus suis]MDW8650043.1 hypothetical protein [Streptococcus suis]HEL1986527.1 hypothetical protein [Streptococcus suis]